MTERSSDHVVMMESGEDVYDFLATMIPDLVDLYNADGPVTVLEKLQANRIWVDSNDDVRNGNFKRGEDCTLTVLALELTRLMVDMEKQGKKV